jgi:hypothetical protein
MVQDARTSPSPPASRGGGKRNRRHGETEGAGRMAKDEWTQGAAHAHTGRQYAPTPDRPA